MDQLKTFGELFRKYRLKAEIPTLSEFGRLLAEKGFNYEDSIFSHWQSGSRVPQYRSVLLKLIEIFVDKGVLTTVGQANELLSSANQGYLTKQEIAKFQFDKSVSQSPFQVPAQVANFSGREEVIDRIKKLIARRNVFLLYGPPGVGKTALAIRLGYLLKNKFTDGVLWYRLDTSDVMDILLSIAYSLGKDIAHIQDKEIRASTVRSLISKKKVLLIFDNAEVSNNLDLLLPNSENCLVIITSRNSQLSIPIEYKSISIETFTQAEIFSLFKIVLDERYVIKNKQGIIKLANSIGNLPLALHIFANEIKKGSLSLPELINRIEQDSLPLEELPYENRNLFIALDVSFSLLNSETKQVFTSLAVFDGKDFSLEAVSFINDLSVRQTEKILHDLKSVSLIEKSTENRFRIHPVIKKFIRKKLDDPNLFLKAAKYYQSYLSQFDKSRLKSVPNIKQESDNVLYIFKKCYELQYWNEVIALWSPLEQLLYSTRQLNKMRDVYQIVKTEKPGFNIFQKLLFAYLIFFGIYWFWINFTGSNIFLNHISSLLLTGFPLLGGIVGMQTSKAWGLFKSGVGKSLFFISLGCLSWAFGNLIWAYYNFFLNDHIPYPSWADLGYLPSYFFWAIGVTYLPHVVGETSYIRKKYRHFLFLVPVFVLALSYYLVVFITESSLVFSPVTSKIKLFFDIAYPIADAIILTTGLLVGVSFKFLGGKYKLSIYSFVLGFVVLYIADFLFSYTTTIGTFHDGGIVDLFFIVAFFLLAFGTLGFYFKAERKR